ncbi:Nucleotide-binding protein, UspA family [Halapricum desulfuricans]|uniref:Nucleotide-binding protein, UspA family n=2 Tax=Halapricum desulfuricans TaxID=2841257 RepID=A0A897NH05_9EURY|nr:Nucleotide-binding protein, UspA family [Halapricum desulfuricans]
MLRAMSDDEVDPEEGVREAVERSRSGAPAAGRVIRDRFSSDEVFQRIIAAADEEITSGSRELYFSGLAAGFAITITFLLYVSLTASTDGHPILSALLYPLGFIYIIIGGYQLYTENTLPPVALTIERLASVPALLRNWVVVLAGNFTGGALGAAALAYGGVLSGTEATVAYDIAHKGIETAPAVLFTKAAFAGLIVAGVVWVEYGARDTISRLVVVYLAFLAIPLGGLFHVVVSFTEMLYLVFVGDLAILVGMTDFVIPVLLGNTAGGVVLVTVVNYFQTTEHRLESARFEGANRRLSIREWFLGGIAGRSYVPVIDTAAKHARTDEGTYRILVPISNPRTEQPLVEFASAIASAHEQAVVHAVYVVQTPSRSRYNSDSRRELVEESDQLLSEVCSVADAYDVDVETSTVVSHRSFEELFTIADRDDADLVVMGWGEDRLWDAARAERPIGELTNRLPCDFLIVDDQGIDTSRILLPTLGGPNAELSAEVASALQSVGDTEVTLLYVADGPEDAEDGQQFLENWAIDHGLEDAEMIVDESGEIEAAIEREAEDHTMLFLGASERGVLARLVRNTLHLDILDEVEASVVIAERSNGRSLWRRLFGRR